MVKRRMCTEAVDKRGLIITKDILCAGTAVFAWIKGFHSISGGLASVHVFVLCVYYMNRILCERRRVNARDKLWKCMHNIALKKLPLYYCVLLFLLNWNIINLRLQAIFLIMMRSHSSLYILIKIRFKYSLRFVYDSSNFQQYHKYL